MRTRPNLLLASLALSTMLSATAPSLAAEIKAAPVVDDAVVRLGDVFEDAGEHADTVIMQAPAPGEAEKITSYELDRIAEEYALDWQRPDYLRYVTVQREGTPFSLDDLKAIVLDAAQQQGLNFEVEISVFGSRRGLYLPTMASVQDIEFERFDLNDRMDRFTATVLVPTGGPVPRKLKISGNLAEVRLVPMLTRIVAPGDVITQADISWEPFPAKRLNRNSVMDQQSLIGQTVRRPVQPGQPLRKNDVVAPVVVEKGSIVKMTINAGALTLTAAGRALENGGTGDMIRVMNVKSNQAIEAEVISPGLVKVTSNALALAAL